MAGKGDDYRPVNKRKFDESYERIFGSKDPEHYQKDKNSTDKTDEEDKKITRE